MSCSHEGCVSLALFGNEMDRPVSCDQHRKPGMMDVVCLACAICVRGREMFSQYCRVHKAISTKAIC
jgi:hypothetical protein